MIDRFDYFVSEERRKDLMSHVENERLAQRVSQSPNYAKAARQEARAVMLHALRFLRALAGAGGSIILPTRFAARR